MNKPKAISSTSGIADALFTKSQQRVLGLLFGNPARTFYANEIIALAGSGNGAVQRELAKLENAGLVTVHRVGNQRHYRANADAPVFEPLRQLVLKTSGLGDVLRGALVPLASQIRAAFVYGSVAKRKDNATSDVDLMVVSDTLAYAELFGALEDASKRLDRRVSPTLYSRDELAHRLRNRNSFVTRTLGEPKIWVIGDENDLSAR